MGDLCREYVGGVVGLEPRRGSCVGNRRQRSVSDGRRCCGGTSAMRAGGMRIGGMCWIYAGMVWWRVCVLGKGCEVIGNDKVNVYL